jgi:hypothetical protein
LYFNTTKNGFRKGSQILPASSFFQSTSTVESVDYDKDGDLDLFVGARVIPFFYGAPANGFILNNDGKGKFTDVTKKVAPALEKIGLITDAKWIDVNNDSSYDLVMVGEWMPIKIMLQENGVFVDRTEKYGMDKTNGWYNVIEVGDFNGDKKIDFVVGNHGLNSRFKASQEKPISLYVNDFDNNGSVEHVLTRYEGESAFPLAMRNDLVAQMPSLKKKLLRFKNYPGKTLNDLFGEQQVARSLVLNAYTFETAVWINTGTSFSKLGLPVASQLAPVYAILVEDIDKDGNADLLMGGNLRRAKPETGIYNAMPGVFLRGDGKGHFEIKNYDESGFYLVGEVRAMIRMKVKDRDLLFVARNNAELKYFEY